MDSGNPDSPAAEDSADTGPAVEEPTAFAEVVDGITGPPNAGRIAPTVTLSLPGTPSDLRAEDLDSDGHDELLLLIDGMLHIAEVDTTSGEAGITDGLVAADSFDLLGHHQVLLRLSGATREVVTFRRVGDGWVLTSVRCDYDPDATLPIGDLDGDGYPDLAALEGTRLQVLHAPIDPEATSGDVVLDLEIYESDGSLDQMVVTGDRDGDGYDDLVVRWYGFLLGAPGPFVAVSNHAVTDVLTEHANGGSSLDAIAPGLVGDLDGNGVSEVSWVRDNAVGLAETPDDPGRIYAAPSYTHEPPRLTAALAAWGGGAGWWYGEPDPELTMPQAYAATGVPELELMARLGAADPVDYAWTEGEVLYVVPAYGGLPGEDKDGDGFGGADDCDDENASVFPGAIDVADGEDDDCDGAVDELGDDLIAAMFGDASDRAGTEIIAWRGVGGDRVAWAGELGFQVADLLAGTRLTLADGPDGDLVAGDFDGDGQMDLAGAEYYYSVRLAYGPADAAEVVDWPHSWWSFSYLDILGDLDGDGLDDLLLAPQSLEYQDGFWRYETYQEFAFATPDRNDFEEQLPDEPISVIGAFDGNADGVADLLVDIGSSLALIEGPLSRGAAIDPDSAGTWIRCASCSLQAIVLDGDGIADDLVALTTDDRLLVYRGPVPAGAFDLETESIGVIDLDSASSMPGVAVAQGWIYVGMSNGADGRGAVYGFALDVLGDVSLTDAPWIREGWVEDADFGYDLAAADVDGDGDDELIVGSPSTWMESSDGAIFVFEVP